MWIALLCVDKYLQSLVDVSYIVEPIAVSTHESWVIYLNIVNDSYVDIVILISFGRQSVL